MSLVNVLTNNEAGIVRYTRDQKIVIDTDTKVVLVICVDKTTTPIDEYEKSFELYITNHFRVPIVTPELLPVWENPEEPEEDKRIQKTIGEYDAFEFYNDNKLYSIKESLTAAILRVKGKNPNPNVFIQF